MPETRPKIRPLMDAVVAVLEAGLSLEIGDGVAPDCSTPYVVVTGIVSGGMQGPIGDPQADARDRIQVAGVGDTREQADWVRDQVRDVLVRDAINAEFVAQSVPRKVMYAWIDVSTGIARDDRGLPEPLFSALDQYIIATTPF